MITLVELKERLMREEETYLLELLGVSSEDLVNRFDDIIEEKYDILVQEYEEETEEL